MICKLQEQGAGLAKLNGFQAGPIQAAAASISLGRLDLVLKGAALHVLPYSSSRRKSQALGSVISNVDHHNVTPGHNADGFMTCWKTFRESC